MSADADRTGLARALAWFSARVPERFYDAVPVARDVMARAMLAVQAFAAGYDGARLGRRALGFPQSTSANAVTEADNGLMRDGGHDLVRNNPSARRIKQLWGARVVGRGLTPYCESEEWMNLWERWSPNCYAANRANFPRVQRLCVEAMPESGEIVGRRRWRKPGDLGWDGRPLAVPLQIQLYEADQIDTLKTGPVEGGGYCIQGIEFDSIGRPVAIWLLRMHPSDSGMAGRTGYESVRVPYEDLFHLYDEERPGQVRGVMAQAAIMSLLRRLNRFEDTELERRGAEACHVATVEAADEDLADDTEGRITAAPVRDSAGRVIERFAPGMIMYPAKGSKVTWHSPQGSPGYDEYEVAADRRIATGSGFPVYSTSSNLANVNFSAARIGDVDARSWISPWQEQVLTPLMLDVVARWFTEAAVVSGALRGRVADYRVEWQAPAVEEHDREAAAKADALEVRHLFTTLTERQRARGWHPKRLLEERKRETEATRKAGVVVDSDPGQTTSNGQAQSAQPANQPGGVAR